MGCDIHVISQKRAGASWVDIDYMPFDWRSYGMFGFLANIRNYSAVPPLSEPRGLPEDFGAVEERDIGDHSYSWLNVKELSDFDYDQKFEDRRITQQIGPNVWSGAVTGESGEGAMTTFREFLGGGFFDDLEQLKARGVERIVFGFDS